MCIDEEQMLKGDQQGYMKHACELEEPTHPPAPETYLPRAHSTPTVFKLQS
jgi:hypothetical protein